MTALEVLHKYFGYECFRPLQEEIINSVSAGKDTLALLPTGGGKSLCFQIPALMAAEESGEGLCLVVTPLIALMKDQTENLRARGIHAAAIYTGMSHDRQQQALDNCQYGPYRFLYVSPERLESPDFRRRLALLPSMRLTASRSGDTTSARAICEYRKCAGCCLLRRIRGGGCRCWQSQQQRHPKWRRTYNAG